MSTRKYQSKTLGPISAKFVSALKEQGQHIFTLKEAQDLLSKNSRETTQFISDLINRQIVYRLNKGTYLLLETMQESTQLGNWPIIAKALVTDSNYYISYYAAMRLHGMTTHALTEVQITLPKRCRDKEIYHIKYLFVYTKPEHFWGIEQKWVSKQEKVKVSDLERTILDCLSRTDYCGGLIEVLKGFSSIYAKINWDKLIQYSYQYANKAAVKRLGYVVESLNSNNTYLQKLHEVIEHTQDYVLLDTLGEKKGKYYKKWHIRVNIENIQGYLNR
ncbi:MAG: type IV toxin-antitoxin system AbiEi family antitoxin [Legionella sp.]|jgi:predicted transcriptional regulator of viral defense system